jgi:hypothetical protein
VAEPPAVEAFILVVGSRRSGGGISGIMDNMLGCEFTMPLIEVNCRNSSETSLGLREISCGLREIQDFP